MEVADDPRHETCFVGNDVPKLLTFNCHEPYIHCLAKLGWNMVVVDGLPGRSNSHWDRRSRPIPTNARVVSLGAALALGPYDAVIAHNLSDLLSAKDVDAPRVFVAHVNLRARMREEGVSFRAAEMATELRNYLSHTGGIAVGVSEAKLQSWGLPGLVVPPPVDPDEYGGYTGTLCRGLRVANSVSLRRRRFAWDSHEEIVRGFDFKLVGDNPDLGTSVAPSFDALRSYYREHRYFVYTAHQSDEDGYNLALLEAMASGMPIVATPHSSLPVSHGVSGYVSGDVQALRRGIERLLDDPELAAAMGAAARREAVEKFAISRFIERWHSALRLAASTHSQRAGRRSVA